MSPPSATTVISRPQVYDAHACAVDVFEALPGIMSAIRKGMRRNIRDGLSVPQFRCLAFIDRNAGTSVSEVTAFLGVTMPTTSAMVERLANAGYLVSTTAPEDRRRSMLSISPAGRALLKRMRTGAQSDVAQALSPLSPEQLLTLRDAIVLLKQSFHRD